MTNRIKNPLEKFSEDSFKSDISTKSGIDFLISFLTKENKGCVIINAEGTILFINEKANSLLHGQVKDQFPLQQNDSWFTFFDERKVIFDSRNFPVNKVINEQVPVYDVKIGFIHSGHNIQWLNLNCYPLLEIKQDQYLIILDDIKPNSTSDIPEKKNIYDNLPGMVYRCKNEHDYPMYYVSAGAENLTGYSSNEICGDFDFESIIDEEYRPYVWKNIQHKISLNEPFEMTYKITTKDGTSKWVWETGKIIIKENEEYLEGFIADITTMRVAEENLRKSEKQYRLMAENTSDIIWTTGSALKFNYISPSIQKLTGFHPDEIVGEDIRFLLHPDSMVTANELINKYLPKVLEGIKQEVTTELKHRCKNGNSVWSEVTLTPIFNHKKEFIGIVGVTRDITEQRSIRQVLMESEARMRNMLETIKLISISISSDGTIVFCNDFFCELTGYQQREILGKNWFDMFIPQNIQKELKSKLFNKLIDGSLKTSFHENFILTKKGDQRLVKWNNTVFQDNNNHKTLITSIGEDITESRLAETRILELNEELESRVKQRTAELLEANQDLEAFAYSISHDLRAPLRHIDGFTRMLATNLSDKDKTDSHYFQKILGASERMHQMINDLLAFSRIGRKELTKTSFELKELVNEVIDAFKPETENRRVSWKIDIDGKLFADRGLIKSALENLIGNSLKFTRREKNAKIEIVLNSNTDSYIVSVEDNGVGFDIRYADKLFSVFQRLHTDADFEGAGIGLANVKRIIQKHGGNIWAEAELQKRAKFIFALPKSN